MFKKLGYLIFYVLMVSINGFFKFWIPRPKSNILKNTGFNSNNFKYSKEYYNYLIEYNLLDEDTNSFLFGFGKSENDYDEVIRKRLDNYFIFEKNLIKINEFNSGNNSFKLGLNQFADTYQIENDNNLMKKEIDTFDIIKNDFTSIQQMLKDPQYYLEKYKNLSSELIWDNNTLSDVKNQGRCGSCWAFSSTGAIEANMRINNFTIDRLSEQELVDCSKENHGCRGGLMHLAFDYCIENNGLTSNEKYNYTALDGECLYNCNTTNNIKLDKINGSNIKDYKFTIPRSIIDIKASLKKGPISIALDASPFEFRFYKEGIINIANRNTSRINHAVLLTGYSENENESYWIIQNSWGKKWGDDGYAKIKIRYGDGVLLSQLYGVYPYN